MHVVNSSVTMENEGGGVMVTFRGTSCRGAPSGLAGYSRVIGRQAGQITVDEGSTVDLQHVPVLHHLLNASTLLQVHPHPIVEKNDILQAKHNCNLQASLLAQTCRPDTEVTACGARMIQGQLQGKSHVGYKQVIACLSILSRHDTSCFARHSDETGALCIAGGLYQWEAIWVGHLGQVKGIQAFARQV